MKEEMSKFVQQAEGFWTDAEYLITGNRYKSAINRAYYSIFTCVQALLFCQNSFVKTHSGLQSKFFELYIKTKVFDLELGKKLKQSYEKRQAVDYELDTEVNENDAESMLNDASLFLEATKKYLQQKGYLDEE
ncbi:MAG: HEPN domain-containing protein [Flavobacterium sp.]|jgi:uncharacterized protein (UPF0332 family)|nr:HEPN domain-containing protein [Flavobacterium sp.]